MMMRTLYPPLEPFSSFMLPVSSLHTLYVEQSGNPNGIPILFLHGGPGGGTEPNHRRYFDPKKFRIVLFDQRACGKSTPYACLEENTTWDLIRDIENIREHLRIQSWHVFGGSWGSTLALSYAVSHPEKVQSLILRGIFLLRKKEIDWFYQKGTSEIFPDKWEKFIEPIPESERGDLVKAYSKRLFSDNPEILKEAAKAWSVWEGSTSRLIPDESFIEHFGTDTFATAFARIECHYFVNKGFFKTDSWLLDNIHKIANIPGVIVQGRYDVVCPVDSAWELHKRWPSSSLIIIPDAGHAAGEKPTMSALVEATDRIN
jgi:proline iminopeptidase